MINTDVSVQWNFSYIEKEKEQNREVVLSDQSPKQAVQLNGKETITLVLQSSAASQLTITGQNLFCLIFRDISPSHPHWMVSSSSSSIYYHDGLTVCDMHCSIPISTSPSAQPISYTIQVMDGSTVEIILEKSERKNDSSGNNGEEQMSSEMNTNTDTNTGSPTIRCSTCGKSIGKNVYQVCSTCY